MPTSITSTPKAARTFNALADMGYDFNQAIADILDNSISQGAANNIFIEFLSDRNKHFSVKIIDDGIGMSRSKLIESMQIGSGDEDYKEGDLSKYGLGLKTASLSQCDILTVFSRRRGKESAFSWDLNHIKKTDKWELLAYDDSEVQGIVRRLMRGDEFGNIRRLATKKSYTVVLWNDLTGFQKNYNEYRSSVSAENFYHKTLDKLKTYLRLIFHRFLSGENDTHKINIIVNDSSLDPLDPFCRNEPNTMEMGLKQSVGEFKLKSYLPPVCIKRFILPTNPKKGGDKKFSSIEAWEEARGVLSWNDAQGYYIYRNNRLINFGGWYYTKSKDEHDKLARASIDITDEHDELFTIDVKKTRIQLPELLKNHLKDHVNKGFIAEAKRRYNNESGQKDVVNSFRRSKRKVAHIMYELARTDKIVVSDYNNRIRVTNPYGNKLIEDDVTYRMLDAKKKITSQPFGDDRLLWKMIPNPNSEFQILLNSDHPFYELIYGNGGEDKRLTAVMDAFLSAMCYTELKCITDGNQLLFEQMREVSSLVLSKYIEEKIL